MRKPAIFISVLILGSLLVEATLLAQVRPRRTPRRALPPAWTDDVTDVFFPDARKKLSGERPNFSARTGAPPAPVPGQNDSDRPPQGDTFAWSKLISPETLEDEVKRQKALIDKSVTTPGNFKSGQYRDAYRQFTALAAMLAIAAEYDTRVRWQSQAPALRDLFGKAAAACRTSSDQAYAFAKQRKGDLEDLVRGERVDAPAPAEDSPPWGRSVRRPPLMQRMEQAFEERLRPAVASQPALRKNQDAVFHEAQILAALAEVIQREGFEYWDDEDYAGYAQQLRDAATDVVSAVKLNQFEAVRKSAGEIKKACSNCHEDYRG